MLKIKKGLKKKGKGKKEKGEDLFDPVQLAKYKKELEEQKREASSSSAAATDTTDSPDAAHGEEDEEWKRFKLLTAGIDSTLKKTSGDLDRIKTSSYFQRKQPLGEEEEHKDKNSWEGFDKPDREQEQASDTEFGQAAVKEQNLSSEAGRGETLEPEHVEEPEEVGLEDEYFDLVDAIASGALKLAYIPDSPTEDPDGDDPFDTSGVAAVVKRIEEEEKKEKRRVNLGGAVGFLTGKAEEESRERERQLRNSAVSSHRRRRPVNVNLLGDFDDDSLEPIPSEALTTAEQSDIICTQDLDLELNTETLLPSHNVLVLSSTPDPKASSDSKDYVKELLAEFETFGDSEPAQPVTLTPLPRDDEYLLEDEFSELATESLSKSGFPHSPAKEEDSEPDPFDTSYAAVITPGGIALGDRISLAASASHPVSASIQADPFDTSALNSLQPGSAELRLIEQELEAVEPKIPVRPPPPILLKTSFKKLPSEDDDFDPREGEAPVPAPKEQHPLDLAHEFGSESITLSPQKEDFEAEPDPFDTSNVPTVIVPGKTELRLLESELVDYTNPAATISLTAVPFPVEPVADFEFDPREGEDPFVVSEVVEKVIGTEYQEHPNLDNPLCPVPVSNTKAEEVAPEAQELDDSDPFDTSTVKIAELYLGKKELKVLESELLNSQVDVQPPQNPLASLRAIQSARPTPILEPKEVEVHPLDHTDIEHSQSPIQPLSPSQANGSGWDDPFDTSVANAILPSKVEVKLLEEELGVHDSASKRLYEDAEFNPRAGSSPSSTPHFNNCPLVPTTADIIASDPFDTSAADCLGPGKTELKVLEAELL